MDSVEDCEFFENFHFKCKKIRSTRKLQELAAELMTIDDKTNALKLYNRSIAVSPANAVDLPIAYANKSAVLLEMKNYEACMNNINLALKHSACPVWLVAALFERKIKCLILTDRWNENAEKVSGHGIQATVIHILGGTSSLSTLVFVIPKSLGICFAGPERILSVIVDKWNAYHKLFKMIKRLPFSNQEKMLLKIRLNEHLLQLYYAFKTDDELCRKKIEGFIRCYKKNKREFNPSDSFTLYASGDVEVVQNKIFGRHLIAKNALDKGHLLLKEKALVSCLYLNEVYDYCSCCLVRTHVLIPCFQCSRALFCSKYCLSKAMDQYHRVECPLMEYFVELDPEDQHVQYIIRLICFLSGQGKKLDELIELWQEWRDREKSYTSNPQLYTVPSNYLTLFLSFDKYSYMPLQFAQSRIRYTALVHKLREKTDFFSHSPPVFNDRYFEYLVTNLLVDLEAYFKCNSFCVSDIIYPSKEAAAGNRKNIGLACYRKSNFFNHSCVPNAAYSFESGDTIAVYSLRKIRPGEQIFICYLNTYYEVEKSKRNLLPSYSFECRCVACTENWPTFDHLQTVYDVRFCECDHRNAFARRLSVTACRFCRFKRDLAVALKTIRDELGRFTEVPFHHIVDNLKTIISHAMDLFQSLDGIEVHLIKEYVELYRLYCRCIEIPRNVSDF